MSATRLLVPIAAAGLLVALAACGGAPSRSAEKGPHTAFGGPPTGQTPPEFSGNNPARPAKSSFKGRIIAISDSMLVHGGSDTLRFGRLGSGEIAVQRFRIDNRSAKPLVILATQRSCGCISLDHDAQPIAPGQTRNLEMTFDSRGEYGWQLKRMDILLAGAEKPLRIFVEADIE